MIKAEQTFENIGHASEFSSGDGLKQLPKARILLGVLFLLSGFSALGYQMIWQRMLGFFCGVDTPCITIVVAAYMMGMGLGSVAGGYLADRLSRARLVLTFACAELLIAAFAISSKFLIYDVLCGQLRTLADSQILLGLAAFVVLLLPTFCMGITLPVISKAVLSDTESASTTIGTLYGVNTLGAALGALVTPLVLIRSIGLDGSLVLEASLNLLSLVGASWVFHEFRYVYDSAIVDTDRADSNVRNSASNFSKWALVYCTSGFVALSLELLWFRLFGIMLKQNSFTVGWLLCIYLFGVATGSLIGTMISKKMQNATATFFLLQSLIPTYAALSIGLFLGTVDRWSALQPVWDYMGSYEPFSGTTALRCDTAFLMLYVAIPLILIFPATFLMGLSFPILQEIVQTKLDHLGRRVGLLQTANIIGSTVGAVITGLFLLTFFGTANVLKLLFAVGIAFGVLSIKTSMSDRSRVLIAVGAVAVIVAGLFLLPHATTLWSKVHGTNNAIVWAEDGTGVSVLKTMSSKSGVSTSVYANGLGQSFLPFGSTHSELGILPAFLHPNPKDIAVIGLGSGDTVFSAGGRKETESITCIEINEPEYKTLQDLRAQHLYPCLDKLFGDKRMHFEFADARKSIQQRGRLFDIIEADALRRNSAYAGNLYSKEYFSLLKSHLKPGGFAVTWVPSERTENTFHMVFPFSQTFGCILIGSDKPIAVNSAVIKDRLNQTFAQRYYSNTGIEIRAILDRLIESAALTKDNTAEISSNPNMINTDLFPRDEYMTGL